MTDNFTILEYEFNEERESARAVPVDFENIQEREDLKNKALSALCYNISSFIDYHFEPSAPFSLLFDAQPGEITLEFYPCGIEADAPEITNYTKVKCNYQLLLAIVQEITEQIQGLPDEFSKDALWYVASFDEEDEHNENDTWFDDDEKPISIPFIECASPYALLFGFAQLCAHYNVDTDLYALELRGIDHDELRKKLQALGQEQLLHEMNIEQSEFTLPFSLLELKKALDNDLGYAVPIPQRAKVELFPGNNYS